MNMTPTIDVIVPVRNGGDRFEKCLTAIRAQRGVVVRLIVVDNGSDDASVSVARAAADVVLEERRRGSYSARNAGLRASQAPYVAFTDADCVPDPRWLVQAVRALEAGSDLVAGRVVHADPKSRVGEFDATTYLDQELYVSAWGFGATANLVVRRAVVEGLGEFRSDLVSGGDVEFCLRARDAGFILTYAHDAIVEHEARSTIAGVVSKAWRHGRGHAQLERIRPIDFPWPISLRRLLPTRSVLRSSWRRPWVSALDLVNNWTALAGHIVERRHLRRESADLSSLMLSAWWPTSDRRLDRPFIADHARALALLGPVSAYSIEPGLRGSRPADVGLDAPTVRSVRVPIPWRIVEGRLGGHLLWMIGWLWAGAVTSAPAVVVVHCFQYAGPFAAGAARRLHRPLLYVEHWSSVTRKALRGGERASLRLTVHGAASVLAVSNNLATAIEETTGADPGSVELVPNPIPQDVFQRRAPQPVEGCLRLVQVADFRLVKGHQLLVDALIEVKRMVPRPAIHITLVGDGPERSKIMRQMAAAQLEELVAFKGKLARTEVAEEIARAHWVLLTSETENRPVVIDEAAAIGRPVLVPDVGDLGTRLRPEHTVIYRRSPVALAEAMASLREHDHKLSAASDGPNPASMAAVAEEYRRLIDLGAGGL